MVNLLKLSSLRKGKLITVKCVGERHKRKTMICTFDLYHRYTAHLMISVDKIHINI